MQGIPDKHPSPAWSEAWDSYELQLMSLERSQCTIRNQRSETAVMGRYFTGLGMDPSEVTKAALTRFLLASYVGRKPGGKVAHFTVVRSFWRWYSQEYEVPDPSMGLQRPKGGADAVPIVRPEDFGAVLDACQDKTAKLTKRNQALVWLLTESGLRRFEAVALNVADVDLKARTATVLHGKGNKARVAVFGPDTALALTRWLRLRGNADGPLFTSNAGGRLTSSGVSQVLRRVKARSGVQVRPHMFRHTWADGLKRAGVQDGDIMQLAGWTSTAMLARYGAVAAQERAIAAGLAHPVGKGMRAR